MTTNTRIIKAGTTVTARDGVTKGTATGSVHRCQLAGCNGARISVRWAGNHTTFPCSKGMRVGADGAWFIE